MKKYVRFLLAEDVFNRLKAALAHSGETVQSWGERKASERLSESVDDFGVPLLEMAFDRSSFQNKIAEKVIGALGEYAFVQIAKKNGQKKWITHKETEVEGLLLQMAALMDLPTKGRFDKKKAAIEIIEFYRDRLTGFVTRSKNAYAVYYKVKPKNFISYSDLWPLLDRAIEVVSENG